MAAVTFLPQDCNVVLKVGRDHSAVAWYTLLPGCLPLVAADYPSAGGLLLPVPSPKQTWVVSSVARASSIKSGGPDRRLAP